MTTLAPTHSSRRINAIAEAVRAQRYLEIGLAQGRTFANVTVETRLGVDPFPNLDREALTNERTSIDAVTSDAFFEEYDGPALDVIFLDGLHKFEQTFRDLINALDVLAPGGAILIDDTKPMDVFSAVPDREKALAYRRAAGDDNSGWHGDVFKVVFAIHDFFPRLAYRTFDTGGNPQTLAWRDLSEKARRKPRFGDLEAISRLSYFDMVDNIDVLRLAPELDILEDFQRRG